MTVGNEAFTDAELAARARGREQAAYRELMTRHRDAVFRLARSYAGDADDALDLTQEAFIAAFAALDRYDPSRAFRPWLLRIALNKCRDWSRRRAVRRLLLFATPVDDARATPDPAADPETRTGDVRELERVSAAIARLPASLKEPLILTAIEGQSQAEAAATLGLSEKAIEVRVYRARRRLSELLERDHRGAS
ncbi:MULTISPECIES: RNA polymerase sigma factor [Sphingomonas]|nr:RNA polymerase sigma factor [Sphingomonas sp. CGMCC 1.13658]